MELFFGFWREEWGLSQSMRNFVVLFGKWREIKEKN
jgi:hypothetical protein